VVPLLLAMGAAAGVLVTWDAGWPGRFHAAVLVVLVGLAGTRAGRTPLAVLTLAGIVLATGWSAVAPAIGLLGVGVLKSTNARDRSWGAGIGVLGALGLLGMRDLGVTGLSAAVAAVVAAAVLWSGYRRSRSAVRRRVRRLSAAAIAVVLVAGALGVLALAQARPELESAVDSTLAAAEDAADARSGPAAAGFAIAAEQFGSARAGLERWWTLPARALPAAGDNYRVLLEMARAGETLALTGAELSGSVDYQALSAEGGGVDVAVLAGYSAPVERAATELGAADDVLSAIRSPWLVAPVRERLDQLLDRVGELRYQARIASLGAKEGPTLLGADRPRRYLVLLGSSAELRDLGGHLGNWAEVVVDGGRIDLVQVGKPADLSQPSVEAELAARLNAPAASLLNLRPATFPQNWSGSPDFAVVTALSAELFERATGRRIDGVIYADASVLDAMLEVTGPVPVPGLDRELAAGEAERFVTVEQFEAFPTETEADESVRLLIEDVFERFTRSTLPGPSSMAATFGPLVDAGRLRLATTDGSGGELLERLGLDRRLEVPADGDLLAVVNRNANPSKIDVFLERDVDHRVLVDADTGRVRARTEVELRNTAPSSGLSPIVIGNRDGLPSGTNLTDVAILSPLRLAGATLDGEPVPVTPSQEGDLNRYTVRVPLAPGGSASVAFDLEGQVAPGAEHRLRVVRQPLVSDQRVTVRRVDRPAGLLGGAGSSAGATVLEGSGTDDVVLVGDG
jgi:hypothetical protein